MKKVFFFFARKIITKHEQNVVKSDLSNIQYTYRESEDEVKHKGHLIKLQEAVHVENLIFFRATHSLSFFIFISLSFSIRLIEISPLVLTIFSRSPISCFCSLIFNFIFKNIDVHITLQFFFYVKIFLFK